MQYTILLVEDDEALRHAIEAHLLKAGFAVIAVDGAMAALRELDTKRAHLLLTDLHLPGGGPHGLSLGNMVKSRFRIPVILITGYRDLLDASHPPGTVFEKPVDFEILTAEIVRQLGDQPVAASKQAVRMDIDSPEQIRRWRMKAEEIRTAAGSAGDKHHMLRAAETYDALANNAEARRDRRKKKPSDAG
jgi:DNA-binding NtrC family response regulator